MLQEGGVGFMNRDAKQNFVRLATKLPSSLAGKRRFSHAATFPSSKTSNTVAIKLFNRTIKILPIVHAIETLLLLLFVLNSRSAIKNICLYNWNCLTELTIFIYFLTLLDESLFVMK